MISIRESEPPSPAKTFAEEIDETFSEKGLLSRFDGFEWRPQQQEMAREVASALESHEHLVIEAGTGVGKSLAYLIPSVLHAVRERRRALVCTHTINLQEQLLYKDVPQLQQMLPVDFSAALLKGRQNYLCPKRVERALATSEGLLSPEEVSLLQRIAEWGQTAKEGTVSEIPFPVDPELWQQVCSERHICTQKTCGQDPRCFYQRARRIAQSSDLLVLNHTLFFTLLGSVEELEGREHGYLFPNDFVVFDEAHTLETIASRHIGLSVSQYGLRQAMHRLYNPKTQRGLFQALGQSAYVPVVADSLPRIEAFFEEVGSHCHFGRGREARVREPGITDGSAALDSLGRTIELVRVAAEKCDNETLEAELHETCRRLLDARHAIHEFLVQDAPEHVYWVEQTGKSAAWLSLNAAPIDLADALRRILFRPEETCVLTSATLSAGEPNLRYFRGRVGADDARAVQLGSPFDYERQMKLHVVRKMPDPRDPKYEEALAEWIDHFTRETNGRAFVLFTSYRTMSAVAERLRDDFEDRGWEFFVQGEGLSRIRMIDGFRNARSGVLFGTDSFWSGVDVPGEALSNVIITRLPFVTPDHPLTEAKLEALEAAGKDPFRSYSVPEAILKLRQGVGRLIRSRRDEGIIVLLDSRVVTRSYGRYFLNALPKCPVEIH